MAFWSVPIAYGSSPLARGIQIGERGNAVDLWFIPAGAGNRNTPSCAVGLLPVHPRMSGEHFESFIRARFGIGLSPLVQEILPPT